MMIKMEEKKITVEVRFPYVVELVFKNGKEKAVHGCEYIEIDDKYITLVHYETELYKVKKCLIKGVA